MRQAFVLKERVLSELIEQISIYSWPQTHKQRPWELKTESYFFPPSHLNTCRPLHCPTKSYQAEKEQKKKEMKKGHPKIFLKITVKTLLSKYVQYFKSPFLWTLCSGMKITTSVKSKFYCQLLESGRIVSTLRGLWNGQGSSLHK